MLLLLSLHFEVVIALKYRVHQLKLLKKKQKKLYLYQHLKVFIEMVAGVVKTTRGLVIEEVAENVAGI